MPSEKVNVGLSKPVGQKLAVWMRPLYGQYERQFDATTYGKIHLFPYVCLRV